MHTRLLYPLVIQSDPPSVQPWRPTTAPVPSASPLRRSFDLPTSTSTLGYPTIRLRPPLRPRPAALLPPLLSYDGLTPIGPPLLDH